MTQTAPDIARRRRLPFALTAWALAAVAVVAGIYWAVSAGLLSWDMAVEARSAGQQFVAQNAILAYAAYTALFVVLALALFPAQLWIIVFGAMLFGFWPAIAVSWFASVLGALAVFLVAQGAVGGFYRARASRYLARVEEGFRRNQLSWMLTMRFIPFVPYFVANVAPAALGARLTPFAIATLVGVMPYVASYCFIGARTASVFDSDHPPDVAGFAADLTPVLLLVAALPILAMLVRRRLQKLRADGER